MTCKSIKKIMLQMLQMLTHHNVTLAYLAYLPTESNMNRVFVSDAPLS